MNSLVFWDMTPCSLVGYNCTDFSDEMPTYTINVITLNVRR
jgi:hypothetical protein